MEYGKDYRANAAPVELLEGKEGLIKVTVFDEIIPFTLRALLKGYKCTDEMIDRVENASGIFKVDCFPVHFFITYNPHCFASCVTHTNISLHLGQDKDILVQNEIMDLVESLPGSLRRPGNYQYLRSVDEKKKHIKIRKLFYEPPVFDTSLRYLSFSSYKQSAGNVTESKCMMVLYVPQ